MFFFGSKLYSLRKSRHILHANYQWYKKKGDTLSPDLFASLESDLKALEEAIFAKDRVKADKLAKKIETFTNTRMKKSWAAFAGELVIALVIALTAATLIRQVWFELYEIPTGSMRPTFLEKDHLLVSKTTFGINFPLKTDHIYFDPSLVKRGGIAIFSGDKIDLPDTDTTYFGIFPYKKRYIKRCMGKPGDTLYFYGGKIYGIDKEGRDLTELRENPYLDKLEYIPFLTFEGRMSYHNAGPGGMTNEVVFRHMNESIGRVLLLPYGKTNGEIHTKQGWVKDNPQAAKQAHNQIKSYSDFWGMRNFAMARLLTKEQVGKLTDVNLNSLKEGVLYLELRHTPNLTNPSPAIVQDQRNRSHLLLTPYTTIIPLKKEHLQALLDNMYTIRFVVKSGIAKRYSLEQEPFTLNNPSFPHLEDGTYEFYYGQAWKIGWGGAATPIEKPHPIYNYSPEYIQKLFNLGTDFSKAYTPHSIYQTAYPSRYAYFRDGDLYLLGASILKKGDPTLEAFQQREATREQKATPRKPYLAFRDYGPPLKEGKIDKEFIRSFGLKIPEHHYLLLGDNHAVSGDSRYFGFVPQQNLEGSPSLLLWPLGPRWGIPAQQPYPWQTLPNLTIWGIAIMIALIAYALHIYRLQQPLFAKQE